MTTGFVSRFKGKITAAWLNYRQDGQQAVLAYFNSGAPTSGGSGTLAGIAPVGALLVTDEPALYQNTGTKASPTWTAAPLTGAAGVTSGTIAGVTINSSAIGGSTPAAGAFTTLSSTGLVTDSVAAGLVASVTQTQIGALGLTKTVNQIATCAHSADAVRLAALTPGQHQDVYNDGANPAAVWPATSGNIDGAGANTAVTLTNAKRCRFTCTAANVIESAQLGAVSA